MSDEHEERVATAAASGSGEGEWVMPAVSYVDPVRRHCALCGRPIARRYWREAMAGAERTFCDPGHAALYATYPKSQMNVGKDRES